MGQSEKQQQPKKPQKRHERQNSENSIVNESNKFQNYYGTYTMYWMYKKNINDLKLKWERKKMVKNMVEFGLHTLHFVHRTHFGVRISHSEKKQSKNRKQNYWIIIVELFAVCIASKHIPIVNTGNWMIKELIFPFAQSCILVCVSIIDG